MKKLIVLLFLFVSTSTFSQNPYEYEPSPYVSYQRYLSFEYLKNDTVFRKGEDEMVIEINETFKTVRMYSTHQMYTFGYYTFFKYTSVENVKDSVWDLKCVSDEIIKARWEYNKFSIFLPNNEVLIFKDLINGN